jgi:hypothetical protein
MSPNRLILKGLELPRAIARRTREENRKLFGVQSIALDLIRETRDRP